MRRGPCSTAASRRSKPTAHNSALHAEQKPPRSQRCVPRGFFVDQLGSQGMVAKRTLGPMAAEALRTIRLPSVMARTLARAVGSHCCTSIVAPSAEVLLMKLLLVMPSRFGPAPPAISPPSTAMAPPPPVLDAFVLKMLNRINGGVATPTSKSAPAYPAELRKKCERTTVSALCMSLLIAPPFQDASLL